MPSLCWKCLHRFLKSAKILVRTFILSSFKQEEDWIFRKLSRSFVDSSILGITVLALQHRILHSCGLALDRLKRLRRRGAAAGGGGGAEVARLLGKSGGEVRGSFTTALQQSLARDTDTSYICYWREVSESWWKKICPAIKVEWISWKLIVLRLKI